MEHKIKTLSIYKHYLSSNRGTPIRVLNLILQLSAKENIEHSVCSQDETLNFDIEHFQIGKKYFSNLVKISQYINEKEVDVVLFHTLMPTSLLIPLKLRYPTKKFILEMHGFNEEEGKLYGVPTWKYYRDKLFHALIYKLCDAITTCSDTATEILKKYNKNVVTIYGGVNLETFNPEIKPTPSFKRSTEEIIIGYTGNARAWQGVPFLIDVFNELCKNDPSFRLVLLLSEKIEIDSDAPITVLDAVPHDKVAQYTSAFDILVIPRPDTVVNRISFPSKLMDYMAMGKPVIGSKTSDVHRIIEHGVDGFLYAPGNKQEMLACFKELKNPMVRKKIGSLAFKKVSEQYTWECQGEKLWKVITRAISRKTF